MIGFIFPGQASQFEGMGKDMYDNSADAARMFEAANDILGFRISDVMFNGSAEDLKQTKVTQPAVFLHSVIKHHIYDGDLKPDFVAGHSLGEISALVACGSLSFESGLELVKVRANAMQKACEIQESTMAAIVGLDDDVIEKTCEEIDELVIPANYNCPGQLVISGTIEGVNKAVEKLKKAGARMAIVIPVGGAFHSPLMEPAKEELEAAINNIQFNVPQYPIFQNVNAEKQTDPDQIKSNLIDQLTAPVKWTQTMHNMIAEGVYQFVEVGGTGKVLSGFLKRIDRKIPTQAL